MTTKKTTKQTTKKTAKKKPYVVVRTYSAGVHYGVLEQRKGKEVTLSSARRLWSWQGAFTLHAVAANGIKAGSKPSEELARIDLTEAIEVLHTTAQAEKILREFPPCRP